MRQCGVPAPYRTGSWWDESTTDYQAAQLYLRLGQYIDIAGSGEIDR